MPIIEEVNNLVTNTSQLLNTVNVTRQTLDNAVSTTNNLVAQHQAAAHPHEQYVNEEQFAAMANSLIVTQNELLEVSQNLLSHQSDEDPYPQYFTKVQGTDVVVQDQFGTLRSSQGGSISINTTKDKIAKLGINAAGFNSYELIYRHIVVHPYNYAPMLSYFQECNVNFVRLAYPCFTTAEWTSHVFNGPTIPTGPIQDSDFRTLFLQRSDEVIDAMNQADVKGLFCLFWSASATAGLFSESVVQGIRRGSQTHSFMIRFAEWFFNRYKNNKVLASYSFFNELVYDVTGVNNPTPANIGDVTADLVAVARKHAPHAIATSDFSLLTLNSNNTRPTFTSEYQNIRRMTYSLDTLGVHIYGSGPSVSGQSFVGIFGNVTAALGPTTTNTVGYEGWEACLSAYRSIAESMNMPLWVTECGVPTDVDAGNSQTRRGRMIRGLVRQADLFLIWNAANVASPQTNQVVWQIQPGQALATTYQRLLQMANAGKANAQPYRGGGTAGLLLSARPNFCFTGERSANGRVSFTSTAAMLTNATQGVMFWARRNIDSLNSFERIIYARNADGLFGFSYVGGSNLTVDSEYIEFRNALGSGAGGTGNSAARLPRIATNTWNHYAFNCRTINGTRVIEMWFNGLYYGAFSINMTQDYVGIAENTVVQLVGGEAVGAPMSMQDFTLLPYVNSDDVWRHMSGEMIPHSSLHVRADQAGVRDISRSAVAITVGSTVTVTPA